MKVNQNIEALESRIENLICKDQVPKAIDVLISWLRANTYEKEFLYEVLIISSNYRYLKKQLMEGILPLKDHRYERNKLLNHILFLLSRVAEYYRDGSLIDSCS